MVDKSFPNNDIIELIYKDLAGRIYLASQKKGMYIYENNILKLASQFPTQYNYLSMYHDQEGNYWLGTRENGVLFVTPQGITHYHHHNNFNASKVNNITHGTQILLVFNG